MVDALAARDSRDVEVLRAVLLLHLDRLEEAEQTSRRLVSRDGFDAGARYLLGSCRELRGDLAGAAHHNGEAAYLDPGFAMPRLRLGLLAAGRGDVPAARAQLHRAVVLLGYDDPDRILLFGGGFTREALVALCQAELADCGGGR
jgi:chemotaxis protein methyltransferase CheR